ncbi:MAG: hypothetical protein H2172_09290 [Opitutus sp.]|nr:hypothetical protein [Opitutus sp.]MCS6246993.1 hypothetical protein [Opitutus sp.]MCS6273217.1 hypothetical protein [Opitutus sp.]MCS6276549.1 hypothetical protein [Opitutus sp.]MCS6301803.1 hypothetical protein [Opitutus sp.]
MALSLAVYVGYREVALRSLLAETAAAETEVANTKVASRQAVELFGKFKEHEKAITGLQQFVDSGKLVVSDFVLHLGAIIPPNIRLNSIDYKSTGVVLRGDITGAAEEASGLVYTYLDVLRKDKVMSGLFDVITLTSVARDAGAGRMKFEFGLKFKGGTAKKGGGGK